MNREELIEEVAKAMHAGDLAASYASWDDSIEDTRNVSRRRARAALAVFEQAHTPTDDERVARLREAEAVIEDALPMLGLFRAWNVTPGQIENLHRILSRYKTTKTEGKP